MISSRRFQLHHTGIKTYGYGYRKKDFTAFQLHHTGIKTDGDTSVLKKQCVFQLHHTRPLQNKEMEGRGVLRIKGASERGGSKE